VAAGNNQTGLVGTTLPVALQVGLRDPYTGNPMQTAGIPVTFSNGGKDGVFSNPTAITDSFGIATTTFTLPSKPGTYTITAASSGYVSATFVETATVAGPASLSISAGNAQKAPVTSPLPQSLNVKVKDPKGNGVAGVVVSFSDGGAGGNLSSPTATTNSSGIASVTYSTGTKAGAIGITASITGLTPIVFKETVLAGPAAVLNIYSGNNQTVKPGAPAAKELEVVVTDQYGNPTSQTSVTYNDGGAGGSFSPNPGVTNAKGIAGTRYTAPLAAGTVTITASAAGLSSVQFTVNVN